MEQSVGNKGLLKHTYFEGGLRKGKATDTPITIDIIVSTPKPSQ
ncbi:hypothetical protein [Vibrio parahaemolyticus]